MSLLNNLLSSIDPTVESSLSTPGSTGQTQPVDTPKTAPRPAITTNGVTQTHQLKRKAERQEGGAQVKIQRKEALAQQVRADSVGLTHPSPISTTTKPSASANLIPYRGTAGGAASGVIKPSNLVAKRPNLPGGITPSLIKSISPGLKSTVAVPAPTVANPGAKKGSYAAMLARAKEVQQTKPAAPPVKHEPTKILKKKEREALRTGASTLAKGKKSVVNKQANPARPSDGKGNATEKRKPTEVGYQGTARPIKKPAEGGYKGTARPSAANVGSTGKQGGIPTSRSRPKPLQGRYNGYASWSDEELEGEEEDEDEEGYDSAGSSDMEGGVWDVEHEEELALKAAKKEDAEALAEENALKRAKEERKRKLAAMNKAAAAKRKY